MNPTEKGSRILHDGTLNKSTAFTKEEREALGLRGLLPHAVSTQAMQVDRVMGNVRRKTFDIEKYVLLNALQDRTERLFYKTVIQHIEELMPIIYTPTVGQACREFSHIFRQSKGLYITPEDKGEINKILDNWPQTDIRVIVVTDGQRILGLGDLGANGMGIPIGKLALYTACAGIHPHQCLPVMLDVGTGNKDLLNDPLYLGYPHPRLEGEAYFDLVEEFVMTVQDKYPNVLIQFEDFLTPNAYALLRKYRDRVLCFNDDIQGTASVALAGVYASSRITGRNFADLKIMFLGAGSAATGIADLMVSAFQEAGLTQEEAYSRLCFVDINGLVVSSRNDLMEHNLPYAHDFEQMDLIQAIDSLKPHVLIGATGAPGTFNQEVIEHMSANNARPVIFALSNPTDRAECTAEEAYEWSNGKAVFASGSPFARVDFKGHNFKPGQGNNAYIFPGIGLGAVACCASKITDPLFLTAAKTLSEFVSEQDILEGSLYPPLKDIREVSLQIAVAVAEKAYDFGLAENKRPDNLKQSISDYMYDPEY
tara:strand:+ start:14168 stop:15781 length:1614 start_codon:yes stop_codon:yes gene_type:complete